MTLFEADARLGGHADTHVVDGVAVDTGFIVHNERTYPHLLRLFDELGVQTQDSEMSMSVRGRRDRPGVRRRARPVRPVPLVAARAASVVPADAGGDPAVPPDGQGRAGLDRLTPSAGGDDDETLRSFLERGGFSPLFRTHFMESLVACVWSCDPAVALDYPARYLFTFLEHHGMLGVFGSPQWRTVTGGSREYVERVAARLPDVRTGTKVTSVLETPTGVEITDGNGQVDTFDAVVVATHPGQALAMLAEPTHGAARRALGDGVLPQHRPAAHRRERAAANCRAPGRRGTICAGRPTTAAP